jgi:hypothetical protein
MDVLAGVLRCALIKLAAVPEFYECVGFDHLLKVSLRTSILGPVLITPIPRTMVANRDAFFSELPLRLLLIIVLASLRSGLVSLQSELDDVVFVFQLHLQLLVLLFVIEKTLLCGCYFRQKTLLLLLICRLLLIKQILDFLDHPKLD